MTGIILVAAEGVLAQQHRNGGADENNAVADRRRHHQREHLGKDDARQIGDVVGAPPQQGIDKVAQHGVDAGQQHDDKGAKPVEVHRHPDKRDHGDQKITAGAEAAVQLGPFGADHQPSP